MSLERVTLVDIARELGVHRTTVARALNHHPGLPVATRNRINQKARQMGYTPDPVLQALTAYRLKKRPPKFHGVIAWLDAYPTRGKASQLFDQERLGAARRCAELGYRLEDFWLHEPGLTPLRLSKILRDRGIQGVLIAPLPDGCDPVRLEWEWFTVVGISPTVRDPKVHLVHNAQYESMREMIQCLHRIGYQRPGMLVIEEHDRRVRQAWSAGFISQTRNLKLANPNQLICFETDSAFEESAFLSWLARFRPDVLVCNYTDVRPILKNAGWRVPQDLGVVWTLARLIGPEASGLRQQEVKIGAAAIDLLTSAILRGERGLPDTQLRVLVSSVFFPGRTIRPHKKNEPSLKPGSTARHRAGQSSARAAKKQSPH
ncbi:MAG: LacI family DNA-binding transcriptional regulator [Candidatus Methylacidiphilales bacterium]|nr:LacI family DNA-binding transcriptional regulator [Candidatus Methylacidiphilales bacterium]